RFWRKCSESLWIFVTLHFKTNQQAVAGEWLIRSVRVTKPMLWVLEQPLLIHIENIPIRVQKRNLNMATNVAAHIRQRTALHFCDRLVFAVDPVCFCHRS